MNRPDEKEQTNPLGVKTEHRKSIGGFEYVTTLYPAGQALDYLPMIVEVASGPLGLAIETLQALIQEFRGGGGGKISPAEVRESLLAMASAMTSYGGSSTAKDLLAHTRMKHGSRHYNCGGEFDVVFQGRISDSAKVLAWVLEVNYAPFLRGATRGALSRLTQTVPELQALLSLLQKEPTSPGQEQHSSESESHGD